MYNTTTQGITKFSDYTKDEIKRMLMTPHKPRYNNQIWEDSNVTLPTNFDWRDQGNIKS